MLGRKHFCPYLKFSRQWSLVDLHIGCTLRSSTYIVGVDGDITPNFTWKPLHASIYFFPTRHRNSMVAGPQSNLYAVSFLWGSLCKDARSERPVFSGRTLVQCYRLHCWTPVRGDIPGCIAVRRAGGCFPIAHARPAPVSVSFPSRQANEGMKERMSERANERVNGRRNERMSE